MHDDTDDTNRWTAFPNRSPETLSSRPHQLSRADDLFCPCSVPRRTFAGARTLIFRRPSNDLPKESEQTLINTTNRRNTSQRTSRRSLSQRTSSRPRPLLANNILMRVRDPQLTTVDCGRPSPRDQFPEVLRSQNSSSRGHQPNKGPPIIGTPIIGTRT